MKHIKSYRCQWKRTKTHPRKHLTAPQKPTGTLQHTSNHYRSQAETIQSTSDHCKNNRKPVWNTSSLKESKANAWQHTTGSTSRHFKNKPEHFKTLQSIIETKRKHFKTFQIITKTLGNLCEALQSLRNPKGNVWKHTTRSISQHFKNKPEHIKNSFKTYTRTRTVWTYYPLAGCTFELPLPSLPEHFVPAWQGQCGTKSWAR